MWDLVTSTSEVVDYMQLKTPPGNKKVQILIFR